MHYSWSLRTLCTVQTSPLAESQREWRTACSTTHGFLSEVKNTERGERRACEEMNKALPWRGLLPCFENPAPTELPREIWNTSLKFRDTEDACLPEELRRVRIRSDCPPWYVSPEYGDLPAWQRKGSVLWSAYTPEAPPTDTCEHVGSLGSSKSPRETQLSRKKLDMLQDPGARKPSHMSTLSRDATSWKRTLKRQDSSRKTRNATERPQNRKSIL